MTARTRANKDRMIPALDPVMNIAARHMKSITNEIFVSRGMSDKMDLLRSPSDLVRTANTCDRFSATQQRPDHAARSKIHRRSITVDESAR